jgi:hypothetical protein
MSLLTEMKTGKYYASNLHELSPSSYVSNFSTLSSMALRASMCFRRPRADSAHITRTVTGGFMGT